MPLIASDQSNHSCSTRLCGYEPPRFLANGHALTIWASMCRAKPPMAEIIRERLTTPDDDFIDVDHVYAVPGTRARRAVLLSHGLEGHSRRPYMLGMCAVFKAAGWDVYLRNFRACSGEINRAARMYHSGETDDLHLAVNYVLAQGYEGMALVGFSMGGNQTLKYLAEARLPDKVRVAAAISVPCDLVCSARILDMPTRKMYMLYFMRTLKRKIRAKHHLYPDRLPLKGLDRMTTFAEFDNAYTAPLHGFKSALDYWERASSLADLPRITTPTLLLNAQDDPFLSPDCSPTRLAAEHPMLYLETPPHGGHVGFVPRDHWDDWGPYWDELRALEFVETMYGGGTC